MLQKICNFDFFVFLFYFLETLKNMSMEFPNVEIRITAFGAQGQKTSVTRRASINPGSTITRISSTLADELGILPMDPIPAIDQVRAGTRLGMEGYITESLPPDAVRGTDKWGKTFFYTQEAIDEYYLPDKGIMIEVIEAPYPKTESEKRMEEMIASSFPPNQPMYTPNENISPFMIMPLINSVGEGFYDIVIGGDVNYKLGELFHLAEKMSIQRSSRNLPAEEPTPGPFFAPDRDKRSVNVTLVLDPEIQKKYNDHAKVVYVGLTQNMKALIQAAEGGSGPNKQGNAI